jgi:hypothetical protein
MPPKRKYEEPENEESEDEEPEDEESENEEPEDEESEDEELSSEGSGAEELEEEFKKTVKKVMLNKRGVPVRKAFKESSYSGQSKKLTSRQQVILKNKGEGDAEIQPRLPVVGPNNEPIWDGTRARIGFYPGTRDDVLNAATKRTGKDGEITYMCESCNEFFSASEVEIDHHEGIISYVNGNARTTSWIDAESGRRARATLLKDAKESANDISNLRVLCAHCNASRGSRSSSKDMDTSVSVWWE